ncbi:helix-hairpin-helix domain-containing protein [uncultured Roseibium sp.]|uniref:helix-hairpin-helix domain-containing protein n=1 Tax=uncultured Roseibium sp. TaxID=1936171 RepID=UPI003216F6B5
MIAKQRLYLTADKKTAVAEGDKRAAFLYAVPGDEIPDSAAKQFGLVDGGLPKPGKPATSKDGQNPAGKDGADDLTSLKGIGKATAKVLADAGIATFQALADIDPAKPPLMIPGSGEADWTKWADAAKEKAGAAN